MQSDKMGRNEITGEGGMCVRGQVGDRERRGEGWSSAPGLAD